MHINCTKQLRYIIIPLDVISIVCTNRNRVVNGDNNLI